MRLSLFPTASWLQPRRSVFAERAPSSWILTSGLTQWTRRRLRPLRPFARRQLFRSIFLDRWRTWIRFFRLRGVMALRSWKTPARRMEQNTKAAKRAAWAWQDALVFIQARILARSAKQAL